MKINLTHKEKINGEVVGLHWNDKSNKILIAIKDKNEIRFEKRNSNNSNSLKIFSIPVLENIQAIETDDSFDKVLIVTKNQALIFSCLKNEIEYQLNRKEGFLSGGFIDNKSAYLTIPASSGCVDWSIWKFEEDSFNEYELERYDHYGRGAVLHPSKKLIGACWNAYESGFLIHLAKPKNNRLLYYDFDEQGCNRKEYESFAPSFNLKGDKIVFVVNPYLGGQINIEKLCVYDIFNQEHSLVEIELEDYQKETVRDTFFLGNDEYVLLKTNKGIDIIDISESKKKRVVQSDENFLSVNPISNQFAIIDSRELQIFSVVTSPSKEHSNELQSGKQVAESFINKFSNLLKVAGDEEVLIYSKIDNLNEIPTVWVKFGFEKANYRLDTKEALNADISPQTKEVVEKWFTENQQTELNKWKGNNKDKEKIILKDSEGTNIEIFTGKRGMEMYPNFRVYHKNSNWMINPDKKDELSKLPDSIKEDVLIWVKENYNKIVEPWGKENLEPTISKETKKKEPESDIPIGEKKESKLWNYLKKWFG